MAARHSAYAGLVGVHASDVVSQYVPMTQRGPLRLCPHRSPAFGSGAHVGEPASGTWQNVLGPHCDDIGPGPHD